MANTLSKNMAMPLIYLNNAATSWPKPESVKQALAESLDLPPFGSGRSSVTQGQDFVSLAREKVASLFHADPNHIIFSQNATDSLNTLINGFVKNNPGCHAIATALDHNSVLRPLFEHQKAGNVRLDIADFEQGHVNPDTIADLITRETRMVIMPHASNVLGSVQDVQAVAELLHDKDIFFIVDGAQTAGHLKIDVEKLGCDAFVFTGHKALLGTSGTGGFYLKDPEKISATKFGGTGSRSNELYQPQEMPDKFECGTQNFVGLAALAAGISYLETVGIENIHEQGKRQTEYLIREMNQENVEIHHQSPDVPVISFNIEGLSCDDVGFILSRAYGIVSRTGLHCAPLVHEKIDGGKGSVRLSLSCFTTDEECQITANAIKEIAQNAASRIDSA